MKRVRLTAPLLAMALTLGVALPAGASSAHSRMEAYRANFASVYGKFVSAYKAVITEITVGNRTAFTNTIVNLDADLANLKYNSPSPLVNADARSWSAAVHHSVQLGLIYANAPSAARENAFASVLLATLTPAQKTANAIVHYLKTH